MGDSSVGFSATNVLVRSGKNGSSRTGSEAMKDISRWRDEIRKFVGFHREQTNTR